MKKKREIPRESMHAGLTLARFLIRFWQLTADVHHQRRPKPRGNASSIQASPCPLVAGVEHVVASAGEIEAVAVAVRDFRCQHRRAVCIRLADGALHEGRKL